MKQLATLLLLAAGLESPVSVRAAFSQPGGKAPAVPAVASTRAGYAGDHACFACHQAESFSYGRTAHSLTSQAANRQTVLGNLSPAGNVLSISDPKKDLNQPALYFRTEAKSDGIHETAVTGWPGQLLTRSEPIDLVTGSGTRGQTYLYWQGDQLFELPVSYWTDGHRWVNSPGFHDGTADFSRPINPGCLECHATYIRPLSTDPSSNGYEKQSLVTGISCETCHGPGAEHVANYATGVAREADSAILNPAKFSRDRQVDACAYCHNGVQRTALAPAFSFIPGKRLAEYFKPLPIEASEHPDVHGNQVGLLQRSRCYRSSTEMSCSTCHNTHAPEKPAASYSATCLKCHQWTSCGEAKRLGPAIVKNCIDCHMPVESTNVIVSETAGEVVRAKLRNHWIKVYPGKQAP